MKFLKCPCCSEDESASKLFIGIFPNGNSLGSTERSCIALYGCPNCHTVQYVSDFDYIKMRKDLYKKENKIKEQPG